GGRRNCEPRRMTHGVTLPHPGSDAGANDGGVGTQTPGSPAPGATYGNCADAEPSAARRARMRDATSSPTPTPESAVVRPRVDSELAYRASSDGRCACTRLTTAPGASAIPAASRGAPGCAPT